LTPGGFDAIDTKKFFIVCDSFRAPVCAGEITMDTRKGVSRIPKKKKAAKKKGGKKGKK
jgi:hypothetical protein